MKRLMELRLWGLLGLLAFGCDNTAIERELVVLKAQLTEVEAELERERAARREERRAAEYPLRYLRKRPILAWGRATDLCGLR